MSVNQLEQWCSLPHSYWECVRLNSIDQNRQRFVAQLQREGHVVNSMTFALESSLRLRQQVLDFETDSQLVGRLKKEIARVFKQKPTKKKPVRRWADLGSHAPEMGADPMWDGTPRVEARARANDCLLNNGKDAVTAIYGHHRPVGK